MKKTTKQPMAERFPCNIDVNLHESLKSQRRYGDASRIAKKYKICRPVVDRALLYGHVNKPEILTKICRFFKERIESEQSAANAIQAPKIEA